MLTARLKIMDVYELLENDKRIGQCRWWNDQEISEIAQANGLSTEAVTEAIERALYEELRKQNRSLR